MPTASATLVALYDASSSRMRAASTGGSAGARRSFVMTDAMASASRPSVPGFAAIHSSALIAVSDSRGPMYTYLAIEPSRPDSKAWARVNPFWYATGDSQVSMKSAPNDTM